MYTICTFTEFGLYTVCKEYVPLMYKVRALYVQSIFKRVCTYKLHHFLNSQAAVCTEYILCASDHSTDSVSAAHSKSIKAFIQIITISVLHPFPLQEEPPAAAGGSAGCAFAPAAPAALASAAA